MHKPFHQLAFFTLARDAGYVTLAGATLMVGFSFAPWLALRIGATVALLFALGMILRAALLSADKITRTEPWRVLHKHERPLGEPGRKWACDDFRELLLRFAKSASGVAILLGGSSLVLSLP